MRIAYIGNYRQPWCTEVHTTGSLTELGHSVVRLQEHEVRWRTLPELLDSYSAELLIWTRTWEVDPDAGPALDRVRANGIPVGFFHLDRWWGLEREYQVAELPCFQNVDVVFSPDGGSDHRWAEAGIRHVWLPPGVYGTEAAQPGAYRPAKWNHRVVFVGSVPYPHPAWTDYRQALLDEMAATFGNDFTIWPKNREALRGTDLADLYRTAQVVVGDSCLVPPVDRYWSDRIPETLGRGGVLLHPEVAGLEDWYQDGVHLRTYPVGRFDLATKIVQELLDDPDQRERLREQGRRLVLDRDTYQHRMAEVVRVLSEVRTAPPGRRKALPPPTHVSHRPTRATATFKLAEGITDAVAVRDVWNDDTYQLVRPQVAGGVVLDIGANVGAFSVLAAKNGARRVVAYEPHPVTYSVLTANVKANGVARVVDTRHAAVLGVAQQVAVVGEGGGAYVVGALADDGPLVPAHAIDQVLADVGEIAYLKLDCEGSEYAIIGGMGEGVLRRVARAVIEFHGPGMPHLAHLNPVAFGPMVAKLASYGKVRIMGRPEVGGLIWWERY